MFMLCICYGMSGMSMHRLLYEKGSMSYVMLYLCYVYDMSMLCLCYAMPMLCICYAMSMLCLCYGMSMLYLCYVYVMVCLGAVRHDDKKMNAFTFIMQCQVDPLYIESHEICL